MTAYVDDRDEEKTRRCLRCQKKFKSKGAGNRICPSCRAKAADSGGRGAIDLTTLAETIREDASNSNYRDA